jgi:hypothetical protein
MEGKSVTDSILTDKNCLLLGLEIRKLIRQVSMMSLGSAIWVVCTLWAAENTLEKVLSESFVPFFSLPSESLKHETLRSYFSNTDLQIKYTQAI